jgi:hypothetical protein
VVANASFEFAVAGTHHEHRHISHRGSLFTARVRPFFCGLCQWRVGVTSTREVTAPFNVRWKRSC